jgi:REP element-mobilizing transposase RayT
MGSGPIRRRLRRFDELGHVRYLTFSCYRRLPLLDHDAIRGLFLDRLMAVVREHHIRLLAWVIMPEHAHLLVFPETTPDIAHFTHTLKRPFAESVLKRWKQLNAPILQKLRHGNGYRRRIRPQPVRRRRGAGESQLHPREPGASETGACGDGLSLVVRPLVCRLGERQGTV